MNAAFGRRFFSEFSKCRGACDALIQLGMYELAARSRPRTLEAYQSRRHPCGMSAINPGNIGSNAGINAARA
jgi:hypothetical protein